MPGIIAISTFWHYCYFTIHSFKYFCDSHVNVAISFFFISAVLMGAICNEMGSWIKSFYDTMIKTDKIWRKYLLEKPNKKIIHSVIKSVVLRLKFNLNMQSSLIVFIIGLNCFTLRIVSKSFLIGHLNIGAVFLLILFFSTGYYMAKGLHEYRKEICSD
jgi:hypothetical protein